ncbi:MAG: Mannitol-phosphate/altronate dehydrogenase [Phycisphaerales bacterium]|nr:Mannitol-phosphate/altronate dehydrogenase [Phycisphaerales bacterium]
MPANDLPETILQFGAGNFLRAFADLFVHEANAAGQAVGRVVVVQSTDSGRAAALNAGGAAYHVLIRGRAGGRVVDDAVRVTSVSRALGARTQWADVLRAAESPSLKTILSNTTEAGLALDPADAGQDAGTGDDPGVCPASFPAKLLRVLARRHSLGLPGLTILPCELVEANGTRLRDLCVEQAGRWRLPSAVVDAVRGDNLWLDSLVDRIVSGRPATLPGRPDLAADPLLTAAEPYALWAIQTADPGALPLTHPAVRAVADVKPYALRKIRILNGAHSALVCKARPLGITTVREAVEHPEVGRWLRDVLFEEIVPVLAGRVDDPRGFAEQTLERFANPFLEHKLADIALNHAAKLKTRLVPTVEEYAAKFGRPPARLAAALAASA